MTNKQLIFLIVLGFAIMPYSVQVTGEESVYTVMAYEMWFHGNWLSPTLYGEPYHRPPLINWLIIGLCSVIGWENSIPAARLVSAAATLSAGWLIFWFVNRCWKDRDLAWLATLLYFGAWQVLGGYGWKGYSDALFGALVLGSMIFAYLSIYERRLLWMLAAVCFAFLGFLTKAITAFVFLGVALIVWGVSLKAWRFLISPRILTIGVLAPVLILLWYQISPTGERMASGMTEDVLDRLLISNAGLFFDHLFRFVIETLLNFIPLTILLLWMYRKKRQTIDWNTNAITFLFVAFLNFLPYWIFPMGHARYLMPLYGLVAIYLATVIYHDTDATTFMRRLIIGVIFFKLAFAIVLFPQYTKHFRPDIEEIAKNILHIAAGRKVYSVDETWIGISVSDQINKRQYPQPPITSDYQGALEGLIYAHQLRNDLGTLVKNYDNRLFLYCVGSNCN